MPYGQIISMTFNPDSHRNNASQHFLGLQIGRIQMGIGSIENRFVSRKRRNLRSYVTHLWSINYISWFVNTELKRDFNERKAWFAVRPNRPRY